MNGYRENRVTSDLLLRAYRLGVFPMGEGRENAKMFWVDPDVRGIIPLKYFHASRSLLRKYRRRDYKISVDKMFCEVVAACAQETSDRPETWINTEISKLYTELFNKGYAHSIECWSKESLVGGLYGVAIGGAFFGESMFSRENDASKIALVHLVERLGKGGFCLLDVQFVTEHLRQFGAVEISRLQYQEKLEVAISKQANFYSLESVGGNGLIVTDGVGSEESGE